MSIILQIIFGLSALTVLISVFILFKLNQSRNEQIRRSSEIDHMQQQWQTMTTQFETSQKSMNQSIHQLQEQLLKQIHQGHIDGLKHTQESMQQALTTIRRQVTDSLTQHTDNLIKQVRQLTQTTEKQLKDISGQVEKRLSEGFSKTHEVFTNVIKRLTIIDEAQKKITELSSNVVSLQSILSDKHARGAFGEVQLAALIRNTMPESTFKLQHTLKNGKRVDCMLFLPEPTGNVAIDAKFPLESYRKLLTETNDTEKRLLEQQFRKDLRKHIHDIASKYIISGETSDGAVMFIPAEAVFAEIHGHFPEIIEEAQRARVWLVSPTTMMAILTTSRAVLKDAATRKQVHIIQEHLVYLSQDFDRFQKRMDNLARHIEQAHTDVTNVNTSAKKITSRFNKIEGVELEPNNLEALSEEESN